MCSPTSTPHGLSPGFCGLNSLGPGSGLSPLSSPLQGSVTAEASRLGVECSHDEGLRMEAITLPGCLEEQGLPPREKHSCPLREWTHSWNTAEDTAQHSRALGLPAEEGGGLPKMPPHCYRAVFSLSPALAPSPFLSSTLLFSLFFLPMTEEHIHTRVSSLQGSVHTRVSSLQGSVHTRVSSLQGSVHTRVSSLQGSVHTRVSSLQGSVHTRGSSLQGSVHTRVSSLQGSVHTRVSSLQGSVHTRVSSLQGSVHTRVSSLQGSVLTRVSVQCLSLFPWP
ncbi:hypothetical protein P7K49_003254 [Saguinus oedipus]|uniref:Uncharacterized protein n=1 Tax=Saguinus oedipus TaxID=9490 RepID=A0ABQ9WME9_SAGOE|nr:hypothetical protein P7K49_003254 [Saguinus oedipus]